MRKNGSQESLVLGRKMMSFYLMVKMLANCILMVETLYRDWNLCLTLGVSTSSQLELKKPKSQEPSASRRRTCSVAVGDECIAGPLRHMARDDDIKPRRHWRPSAKSVHSFSCDFVFFFYGYKIHVMSHRPGIIFWHLCTISSDNHVLMTLCKCFHDCVLPGGEIFIPDEIEYCLSQLMDEVILETQVHLRRIGNVLHRKQWNRRRQRILELATANFCSAITGRRSSLRGLKVTIQSFSLFISKFYPEPFNVGLVVISLGISCCIIKDFVYLCYSKLFSLDYIP